MRMLPRGRRRPALAALIAVGCITLMGAQCQPTKPPGTPPGGGGGTPAPPGGGPTTPPPVTGGMFTANLDGLQVTPPTASLGTGTATVTLDPTETTITVQLTFSGLSGSTMSARIQGPAAVGVGPAPVVMLLTTNFPFGVTAGSYVSPSSLAITATQVSNLKAGLLYIILGSTAFPAGEIRGQLIAVP